MFETKYVQVIYWRYGIKICNSLQLLVQQATIHKYMGTSVNMHTIPNTELSGVTLQIQRYFSWSSKTDS